MIYNEYDGLYRDNYLIVYKFLLKISNNIQVAEDISQETFLKAFLYIDKFKGECKLSVWLCQIAKNLYFSYLKKNSKVLYIKEYLEVENLGQSRNLIDDIISITDARLMIKELEEPYKTVFVQKVFMELDYGEIASQNKKTESWARVTFHRAKIKMKERITFYESDM